MENRRLCFVNLLSKTCSCVTALLSWEDNTPTQQQQEIISLWTGQCRNVSLQHWRMLHLTITGVDGRVYFKGSPLEENSILIVVTHKGHVEMVKHPLNQT